jgi:hypothetical protein
VVADHGHGLVHEVLGPSVWPGSTGFQVVVMDGAVTHV